MQGHRFSLIMAGLFCLGAVAPAAAQDHRHHEQAVAASTPTTTQPWATDAPLRAGMASIHASIEALRQLEAGHMSDNQALAEVAMIDQSIDLIIANCKLEPKADAALHGVLAKLIHGSAGMKSDLNDEAAMIELRAALIDYQRLFDDPTYSGGIRDQP